MEPIGRVSKLMQIYGDVGGISPIKNALFRLVICARV